MSDSGIERSRFAGRGHVSIPVRTSYQRPLSATRERVFPLDRFVIQDGKLGSWPWAAPVRLRDNYIANDARKAAKQAKDAAQTRRLLALAAIYDGASRGDAARIGGVGVQTVRDWVLAFNADGPTGLIDGKVPGQTPKLTAGPTSRGRHGPPLPRQPGGGRGVHRNRDRSESSASRSTIRVIARAANVLARMTFRQSTRSKLCRRATAGGRAGHHHPHEERHVGDAETGLPDMDRAHAETRPVRDAGAERASVPKRDT
ncbi:hypothetical protein CKO28_21460 [Rhodovibrio sodomensis]|uniref:Helix-turn-helix domain-containing protein n=1 Tax=Rhodovibrio sodomensis TaxID=1088 RepID=A0ABS1DKF8_9PROT|nr:hypothetical protein [Rhodovibrio sodomensis]